MVRRNAFDRGDIVRVCLNPIAGREMEGDYRPALVLSKAAFNRLGVALVAPITQGGNYARVAGFAVSLAGSGTETQGVVVLSAVRMLDLEARRAAKVETVPDFVTQDALAKLEAIIA
ncbi:type II toxin-antitoxin system ChpB family toxin [Crenobacter cavernae]|uniref:Type II toxin-antitoxin system ChpB family toxin n=1 Tax=Crenobacter cavernae TaxID=2290923 RepID=A0A345Y8Q0_9NEIS|nr:type II toxin-antitoxin system ChpB family toxin [Crenobacter cavernae]AXK40302.1 type II toxin-antitoxin system ChpB family toxin [Crenobacter cavernae]